MCNRILIIGNSGSGKTTLGRSLARVLAWRQIDLDDLQDGGRVSPPMEEWEDRVRSELEQSERWIASGRDLPTLAIQASLADRVIVLSLPSPLCAWRALVRRPLIRIAGGEDMLSTDARRRRTLKTVALRYLSWPKLWAEILAYPLREGREVFNVLREAGHDRRTLLVLRSTEAVDVLRRAVESEGVEGIDRILGSPTGPGRILSG